MKAKEIDNWVKHYDLYTLCNHPSNVATDYTRQWAAYQYPAEFQKLAVKLLLKILT
jgi:hypothetical protein